MRAWEEVGLYDPDDPDADERRALLEYLASLGLSVDDVHEAACGRSLGRLAADHVLWGDAGPDLTIAEVAVRAGIDEAEARRFIRAAGFADPGDEPLFRSAHAEVLQAVGAGAAIFGDDAILQFTRVVGSATARVAEAAVSLFLANVSPRLEAQGASELELVRQSAEAVRAFGVVPGAMDALLREHFTAAIRRMGLLDIAEGGATAVTVAFVDLVGSTNLAHHVTPSELTAALSVFENTAMDAAVARDCRVIKLIGDEAMIAGASPIATLEVVNEVLCAIEDEPALGAGRAGLAAGYAVSRDGDYFGPVVNLASRLATAAVSGEVLLDEVVARVVADEGYAVEAAGDYTLKGFDEPVPVLRLKRSRPPRPDRRSRRVRTPSR